MQLITQAFTSTLNSPGKILFPVRVGFPFRLDPITFSVRPAFPSTMFRVHYILGLRACRHRAEKLCITCPDASFGLIRNENESLHDVETQRRPNNSRWVQCVEKAKISSCFQRFLHFIWHVNFWLLFELDTFASTHSRDSLPHTRGANGFRDRGPVVQSFSAWWRQASFSYKTSSQRLLQQTVRCLP